MVVGTPDATTLCFLVLSTLLGMPPLAVLWWLDGSMQALDTLKKFETMTVRLEAESKLLSSARDALSLDPVDRDVLGPVQGEIKDLREVSCACSQLSRVCAGGCVILGLEVRLLRSSKAVPTLARIRSALNTASWAKSFEVGVHLRNSAPAAPPKT